MNSNENLYQIRDLTRFILSDKNQPTEAGRLAELVDKLDASLSQGGNLPVEWRRPPSPPPPPMTPEQLKAEADFAEQVYQEFMNPSPELSRSISAAIRRGRAHRRRIPITIQVPLDMIGALERAAQEHECTTIAGFIHRCVGIQLKAEVLRREPQAGDEPLPFSSDAG